MVPEPETPTVPFAVPVRFKVMELVASELEAKFASLIVTAKLTELVEL